MLSTVVMVGMVSYDAIDLLTADSELMDCLSGLVVRVLSYIFRDPGFNSERYQFSER
jgi:hypothetical protein